MFTGFRSRDSFRKAGPIKKPFKGRVRFARLSPRHLLRLGTDPHPARPRGYVHRRPDYAAADLVIRQHLGGSSTRRLEEKSLDAIGEALTENGHKFIVHRCLARRRAWCRRPHPSVLGSQPARTDTDGVYERAFWHLPTAARAFRGFNSKKFLEVLEI